LVQGSGLVIVELGSEPLERVGGKAFGLARLVELGLPVPPAVVVPVGEDLRDPGEVVRLLGEPLAIRSSAVGEDAADRSSAGQYDTVLGVRADGLAAAVARVRGSASGERAQAYGAQGAMAVLLQRQVDATRAGVAFSRDPVRGVDEIFIECALGGGEVVVSGEVTPDRYWVGDVVRARAAGELRVLRDDEVMHVAGLVRRAAEGFGHAVDVEFCFEGPRVWLVQCRAITTP
jgi:rifampicin phosphotransferase